MGKGVLKSVLSYAVVKKEVNILNWSFKQTLFSYCQDLQLYVLPEQYSISRKTETQTNRETDKQTQVTLAVMLTLLFKWTQVWCHKETLTVQM